MAPHPSLPPLLGMPLPELEGLCKELGFPRFRAKQIHDWIYDKHQIDPDSFLNLSKQDREKLKQASFSGMAPVVGVQWSKNGQTAKVLYAADGKGNAFEAVLMLHKNRSPTFCISTQVGCGMGCRFCATGTMGLKRNLSPAEIVGQVFDLRQRLIEKGLSPRDHTLVYMGMGEPLANLPGTLESLRVLTDPERFGMSPRRITVSTIGLADGIKKLQGLGLPIHLAVSLHAPDEEKRREIMPLTERTPLPKLIQATQEYARVTGRRVTLEYILLEGENDDRERARALAKLAKSFRALVNIIPYNPVDDLPFRRPTRAQSERFSGWLKADGAQSTVRYSQGQEVDAACGQLAAKRRTGLEV